MRQIAQLGSEVTYGTAVAVTRRPTSFGLSAAPNMGVATATPRGQTSATQGWISREDSSFSVEGGVLSYDEVLVPLESVCKKVTATTPTGGTLSRSRVYSIDQFAADTFQSYTVESGSIANPNRGWRAPGATFNEWGFSVSSSDDQIGMTGSLVGWKLVNQAMTTTGITTANYQVAIPSHFKLYYAATAAGLTSSPTEITNSFSVNFGISDRRALVRYLGKADGSPSDVVETTPGLTFGLTLADEAAPVDTFLANARAGTKQFFRLRGLHPTAIEGTIFPEFTLDVCAVLGDSPSVDDTDGVQSVTLPYQCAYDSVWNNIFLMTVVNNRTTVL